MPDRPLSQPPDPQLDWGAHAPAWAPTVEHLLHKGAQAAGHSPTAAADVHAPPAQGTLTLATHRLPVQRSHARGAGSGRCPGQVCEEEMPPVSPAGNLKCWRLWDHCLPACGQRADPTPCTHLPLGPPDNLQESMAQRPLFIRETPGAQEHVRGWFL